MLAIISLESLEYHYDSLDYVDGWTLGCYSKMKPIPFIISPPKCVYNVIKQNLAKVWCILLIFTGSSTQMKFHVISSLPAITSKIINSSTQSLKCSYWNCRYVFLFVWHVCKHGVQLSMFFVDLHSFRSNIYIVPLQENYSAVLPIPAWLTWAVIREMRKDT